MRANLPYLALSQILKFQLVQFFRKMSVRQSRFDKIGYTVHVVTEKIDGGAVLLQRTVAPDNTMNFPRFMAHISRTGSQGYLEVLEKLIAGGIDDSTPQTGGGRHYPPAGLTTIRRARKNYERRRQQ
jgi:hypothetical protein